MNDAIWLTTLFPFEKAFRLIARRADNLIKKTLGCGRREMWILLVVNTAGKGQREIGEILGLHPNVVVKLLDGMEAQELVRRVRKREDRREQTVESTRKGHEILGAYMRHKEELLEKIFAPLTAEQRDQWREMAALILKGAGSLVLVFSAFGQVSTMAG